jgi:hypothetical protein
VSFAAITLCVAFQRVFIVVSAYFVIDSVRKRSDTSHMCCKMTNMISFITVFVQLRQQISKVKLCERLVDLSNTPK